ncbi:TPA: hypothetical protein N0F65_006179 [Lagenidium giganteum]|uniref:Uncharacterized protein n=1 Tax=Lagenidium giganteum TaxID=4803 RepID=A0AAV2Z8G8_9STRA|nr:TPA: hypothetical protein N0F65_006179 [Lagenidium giganteum]
MRSQQLVITAKTRISHIFGVHSPYFHEVLVAREVIEIATQVYQAYRCSSVMARTRINNTFIGTVIINCWSTPLIHALSRKKTTRDVLFERIVCIAVDGLLSLITSTMIPLVLFMPYYSAFEPALLTFSLDDLYNISWFTSFLTECRLVFPVTVIDFLSKLTPHVTTLFCMLSIAPLIDRRPRSAIQQFRVGAKQTWPSDSSSFVLSVQRRSLSRPMQATNFLIVLTGCMLFVLHIHAKVSVDHRELPGCSHKIYPWLPSKFPCMVFTYNCYRRGTSTAQDGDLSGLQVGSLTYLSFSHCDALVMPAEIQQFPALMEITIFNSTLVEWGAHAALSNTTQSNLATLLFVDVNFTTFPAALLQPLPPMLSDIEFSHTNLTTLPANLHEFWMDLGFLYLEHCQLTEFPETVTKMTMYDLSLLGNHISNMSLFADITPTLAYASLNLNPARQLPEQLTAPHAIMILGLENMQLDSIPEWLRTDVTSVASVHGNPYCDANRVDETIVKCVARDIYAQGKLPYESVRLLWPL